jgi:hypothetical protein
VTVSTIPIVSLHFHGSHQGLNGFWPFSLAMHELIGAKLRKKLDNKRKRRKMREI